MTKNPPRRHSRPSPTPRTDPNEGRVPCVVGAYNVTPGVLAAALQPYRSYPEVREELSGLILGRLA